MKTNNSRFEQAVKLTRLPMKYFQAIEECPVGWLVWLDDPYRGSARKKFILTDEGELREFKKLSAPK